MLARAGWQFRHVTVPMLRNTLVFVTVMTVIGSFQVFTSVYIMTSGGPERSTEVIARHPRAVHLHGRLEHARVALGRAQQRGLLSVDRGTEPVPLGDLGRLAAGLRRLQQKAAGMLGKEAALYVPSGTMGNACALLAHVGEGDAVFFEERAHLFGGTRRSSWKLAGAVPHPLQAELGVPDPGQLEEAVSAARARGQRPALVCIENTHNQSGGYAWSPDEVEAVAGTSRELGMKVHMDGARLSNAAVAMGVETREYASHADSVMFCLSKGLSAPVGSMLCGPAEFVERARALCRALQGIEGLAALQPPNPTNFVMLESAAPGQPAGALWDSLQARGVLSLARPPAKLRLVLHRHIGDDDVDYAAAAIREAAAA